MKFRLWLLRVKRTDKVDKIDKVDVAGRPRLSGIPCQPACPKNAAGTGMRADGDGGPAGRDEVAQLFDVVREQRLDAQAAPGRQMMLAALAGGRKVHAGCGVGRGMRAVAVDGSVYPCHRFVGLEETRLGQLSDYRAGAINDYHRAVVENLPVCRSCWARYFCGGGCFYDNLACTGDMQRPDSLFCDEMRTVCEDVICGWCALSDEERAYVREQAKELEDEPRR